MPQEFTRRELFKRVGRLFKREAENIKNSLEPTPKKGRKQELSRREFLKFLAALATTLTTKGIGVQIVEAREIDVVKMKKGEKERKELPKRNNKAEELLKLPIKKDSYTETAIEEILMVIAETVTVAILNRLGVKNGNQSIDIDELMEKLEDKPLDTLLNDGIISPTVEEVIFRLLPSTIVDYTEGEGVNWDVGVPVSLIFALGHNLEEDELGELKFAESIPLSQFMAGLFFWYLMRERGISHSILAHSLGNSISLLVSKFFYKIYPPELVTKN